MTAVWQKIISILSLAREAMVRKNVNNYYICTFGSSGFKIVCEGGETLF